jgi:hypothetical protein
LSAVCGSEVEFRIARSAACTLFAERVEQSRENVWYLPRLSEVTREFAQMIAAGKFARPAEWSRHVAHLEAARWRYRMDNVIGPALGGAVMVGTILLAALAAFFGG